MTLAHLHQVTLMVGHTFLYNAGIRKVKECINPDDMGQIYYLYSCRTNLGPIRKDVNVLWDLAAHDISIFNYLLDSTPEWVSAVGAKVLHNTREDVGFVSLGYRNNVMGNIHVSWADPNKVRNLVVVGSQRRVVFDDLNVQEQVRIYEKGVTSAVPGDATFGEQQLLMRDGDIISPHIQASEPLKAQCNHFLDCITRGTQPLTNGQSGLDVVRVLAAIDVSIQRSGAPVYIDSVQAAALEASMQHQVSSSEKAGNRVWTTYP
jgi:predicted dehydrogenase